jgi:class 3 adenylate cyclase
MQRSPWTSSVAERCASRAMPSECLLINPYDPDLKTKVESLAKTPGLCIFIDITGSAAMKMSDFKHWVAKIHNCFANARTFLPHQFTPIKSIGDALMYYVEEPDLLGSGYKLLQVYDGLWKFVTEAGPEFPDVKVGAAWCDDVYPITFLPRNQDYYGIDIDLTARLQAIAGSKEVVIDQRFHQRVIQDFNLVGNSDQFESVKRLRGPEEVDLKGIPEKITIYRGN